MYSDFIRIRNFKLQNSSRENIEQVSKTTEEAFKLAKKDEIEEAISKLLELHGVAIPIASTILAMRFPDKYAKEKNISLREYERELFEGR